MVVNMNSMREFQQENGKFICPKIELTEIEELIEYHKERNVKDSPKFSEDLLEIILSSPSTELTKDEILSLFS